MPDDRGFATDGDFSAGPELTPSSRRWLIVYGVVAAVDIVAEYLFAQHVAFVAVVMAMPTLALVLIRSGRHGRTVRLVMVSLIFCWLGDWVGDLVQPHVPVKIGFFFIAHVCYIFAFWSYRHRSILFRPGYLVVFVAVVGALLVWIAPHSDRLAPVLAAYGAFLGFMAVLATGVHRLAAVGGMIFVSSDMSIALSAFVFPGEFAQAEVVIMGTYLLAQCLIILGVIAATGMTPEPPAPGVPTAPAAERRGS